MLDWMSKILEYIAKNKIESGMSDLEFITPRLWELILYLNDKIDTLVQKAYKYGGSIAVISLLVFWRPILKGTINLINKLFKF